MVTHNTAWDINTKIRQTTRVLGRRTEVRETPGRAARKALVDSSVSGDQDGSAVADGSSAECNHTPLLFMHQSLKNVTSILHQRREVDIFIGTPKKTHHLSASNIFQSIIFQFIYLLTYLLKMISCQSH